MEPKFNINRPPVSDDEIEKHKNFDALVAQFKKQSLKKARGDESWWKNKKVQYTTIILGVTVICTITYQSLKETSRATQHKAKHETISTSSKKTKTPSPATPVVASRLKALNKKTAAYKVNNQKGASLTHPGSTKIHVPKGAFVDREGREIVGEVTLEYREFNHLPDIIAAGIPMRHDSAGNAYQLESAGMFEINASQHGKPVHVKRGAPLTVDLASHNAEDRFYQYYLDTVNRNWRYLGPDRVESARPPVQPAASIADLPQAWEKRIADSLERRYTSLAKQITVPAQPTMPARRRAGRPTFVLESSLEEFPELAAFENVVFEVGPENEHYTPELHEVTWSDIRITDGPVKGKNYILHLAYRQRKEKLVVYPVLEEGDYQKARSQYEAKLASYNLALRDKAEKEAALRQEMERKREMLAREARERDQERRKQMTSALQAPTSGNNQMSATVVARRLFQIASFGIYNSDHPHPVPPFETVQPAFTDAASGKVLLPDAVYVIDHQRKTVITGSPGGLALPVPRNAEYALCVVENGEVYTCDKSTYKAAMDAGTRTFRLQRREGAASHMADFRKALEL